MYRVELSPKALNDDGAGAETEPVYIGGSRFRKTLPFLKGLNVIFQAGAECTFVIFAVLRGLLTCSGLLLRRPRRCIFSFSGLR